MAGYLNGAEGFLAWVLWIPVMWFIRSILFIIILAALFM
jgi:hypothetical protein